MAIGPVSNDTGEYLPKCLSSRGFPIDPSNRPSTFLARVEKLMTHDAKTDHEYENFRQMSRVVSTFQPHGPPEVLKRKVEDEGWMKGNP